MYNAAVNLMFIGAIMFLFGVGLYGASKDPFNTIPKPQISVGPIDVTSRYSVEDLKHLDIYVTDEEVVIEKDGKRLESWRLYK